MARPAHRWGWNDNVLLASSALLTWWLVYLGAAWYVTAVAVAFALSAVVSWVAGRLSRPAVTMDRDGLHEEATWIRLAWRDVVHLSAHRLPHGGATLFLQLADPQRAAGEAGGHRRGRAAARAILESGGFDLDLTDRNLSSETIVGLIRTAVADATAAEGASRPR